MSIFIALPLISGIFSLPALIVAENQRINSQQEVIRAKDELDRVRRFTQSQTTLGASLYDINLAIKKGEEEVKKGKGEVKKREGEVKKREEEVKKRASNYDSGYKILVMEAIITKIKMEADAIRKNSDEEVVEEAKKCDEKEKRIKHLTGKFFNAIDPELKKLAGNSEIWNSVGLAIMPLTVRRTENQFKPIECISLQGYDYSVYDPLARVVLYSRYPEIRELSSKQVNENYDKEIKEIKESLKIDQ